MKLYYNKNTRATRPRWLIEEAGLDVEIVPVDLAAGQQRQDAYRAVHPLGKVPALQDGDRVILESGAITLYLADRAGLAPEVGTPARATYYQWCFYAVTTLEAPVGKAFHELRKPEEARSASVVDDARRELATACGPLSDALREHPWLVDDTFSAADVLVGSVLAWARAMGLLEGQDVLLDYVARCTARPAFARART
ncbi:MAG: hypothetical protein RLZZ299_1913 [Pseudomonadota bacterium]|jgi:glutathione S-transferase